LLKNQKEVLIELTNHPQFNEIMREALAVRLLEQEQARYDGIVRLSELVARLGPMFGLLCTLIPLGPGIIALGQGDTYTLSVSLMTAFDTTIAGLSAAAVATIITSIRRTWYKHYMSILESLATCTLEMMKDEEPCGQAAEGVENL
jgi:biopolymer transport protein ExbB/TolQ